MKKYPLIIIFSILLFYPIYSQKTAITSTGEEVILYENGTWKYTNDSVQTTSSVPTSKEVFEKDKNSTFSIQSKKCNMELWINPKKWKIKKSSASEDAEYFFECKSLDIYAMAICESVDMTINTLRKAAINNAKKAAPDLEINKEEYRIVNGNKVLLIKMTGTVDGTRFSYYSYYYSSSKGTVQLIAFSSEKIINENISEVETFLNGLVLK